MLVYWRISLMQSLSIAMQNYLETVFDLSGRCATNCADSGVRVSDIAAKLDVSKASVNNAMNTLAKLGYVVNEKYQEIHLTAQGLETAALLEGKHKILKSLFADVIGIPEELADEEACAIEHIISHESIQKINEFLVSRGITLLPE